MGHFGMMGSSGQSVSCVLFVVFVVLLVLAMGCSPHRAGVTPEPVPAEIADDADGTGVGTDDRGETRHEPDAASAGDLADARIPTGSDVSRSDPPYDLDSDRRDLVEQAKRELGRPIDVQVLSGVWVFFGMPGFTGGQFRAAVSFARTVLDRLMLGRFDRGPPKAIAVYLFGAAGAYQSYCARVLGQRCLSQYGFFLPSSRKLVMNMGPGWGTLSHEMVHPILKADFPRAPTWLNEGIASLFEAVVLWPKGEIHGAKNWRYPALRAALDSRKEGVGRPSLTHLFSLSDEEFRNGDESLNYALARYFCQWLDAQGKLWAFYRAFRDSQAADKSARDAFTRVMDRDAEEANPEFERWVKALR